MNYSYIYKVNLVSIKRFTKTSALQNWVCKLFKITPQSYYTYRWRVSINGGTLYPGDIIVISGDQLKYMVVKHYDLVDQSLIESVHRTELKLREKDLVNEEITVFAKSMRNN
jgi:hypothetical protein